MQTGLTDGVVLLRPLEMTDCDALYAAVKESSTELSRWLPWCHPDYAPGESAAFINHTIQWWENKSQFTFGIFDAADGTLSGTTAVNHINRQHRYANIGYWIRTGRTRRGFASRSLRIAAAFAFQTLELTRVEIAAQPDNLASRGVAERAGATFEGILRNRIVVRGQPSPAALYSLVPEDLSRS
jgi:RimJ/RimL family protein N-acetyltransferase